MGPVCLSAHRKRTKEPGLLMWPPPSPGDWPVLRILMRRKTGEAPEPSGSAQTCIGMSSFCCPPLCVALHGLCGPEQLLLVMLLCCAAIDLYQLFNRKGRFHKLGVVGIVLNIYPVYLCPYQFLEAWGTIVAFGSPGTLLL